MNFLQLCQRLRSEAGITGTGPSTVIDQTGDLYRVVSWVSSAYEDIQNARPDWQFAQIGFSFPTIIGTSLYTLATVSLTDLLAWKKDDFRIYLTEADESFLEYVSWDTFRATYQVGSSRSLTGRPTIITVKPDDSLVLWPTPAAVYTVDGQYFRKARTMTANTDEPVFKSNFHMAIVWRALMFYGADLGAPEAYAHGEREYKKILRLMEFSRLPSVVYGAPLA